MGSFLLHADLIRTWFESHSRVMQTTLVTSFKSHLDFKLHYTYTSLKGDAKRHWLQHTATYSDGTKFSAALFLAAPATNNETPTSPIRARANGKTYVCGLRKNPRGDPKKDFANSCPERESLISEGEGSIPLEQLVSPHMSSNYWPNQVMRQPNTWVNKVYTIQKGLVQVLVKDSWNPVLLWESWMYLIETFKGILSHNNVWHYDEVFTRSWN